MAINKVEFGNQTLIDLTGDTVTPEDVLGGKTFHTKSGDASVGTAGPYAGSATNGGPATTAKKLFGQDTRSVNSPPSRYMTSGQNSTLITEFKNRAVIDAPGSSNFGTLITITPWMDSSGGLPVQTYVDNTGQKAIRFAQTSETWGSWSTLASNSDIPSVGNGTIKLQRNGVDIMTFTTNQNSNTTGNLIIPTKVSELTNDSEFISDDDPRLTDSRNAKDVYAWAKASTKPSYTASEVGAIATSAKGANGGVAELDSAGKVPSSQLPSFVDDVLEYNSLSNFPTTGETGKIYIAKDTNKTYRWSGTAYVEISPSLALGETSSTAYRGDRGKTAYDHSQSTHARTDATAVTASSTNGNIKINGTETTVYTHPGSGTNPHGTTKSDVGLGNVGNFKAVSTVASQGLSDTEKSNARANIGAGTGNSNLALGETSSTAYRGDRGKTAYDHASAKGSAFSSGLYKITTNSEGHVTAATAVTKADITGLGIPGSDTWRGIQNNLTSDSTTDSLSAAQGKALANGSARDSTKLPLSGGTMTGKIQISEPNGVYFSSNKSTRISVDTSSLLMSPVSKYLYHDLFAFCRVVSPTYYTTANNSTWNVATLNKTLFAQKENNRVQIIDATGKTGSRWVWNTTSLAYCDASWLVIGFTYNATQAPVTLTYESSSDGSTWTVRHSSSFTPSSSPMWFSVESNSKDSQLRLTITKDTSNTTGVVSVSAIKLLTSRWGDQGQGSELEHPYQWTEMGSLMSISANNCDLGSTSNYWKNGYFTNINGVAVGSSPKFTDTTYTFATGDSNGQIKVTPSGGSAQNISVKGLGSAAYTASTAYAAASHTHAINQVTWAGGQNLATSATANGQEWSIDMTPGSYTGTYFQVWSSKNSKTVLACYADNNKVAVPNGNLEVGGAASISGNLTVASVNGETVKYTSSVNAVVGDTTCTISDSSIATTSLIEPFSSNSTGDTIAIKNIAVTAGQAVLTFKALTVDTSFRLRITNV